MTATISVEKDMERVFALQTANQVVVGLSDADERSAKMRRLREVILNHADAIQKALAADLGKPMGEGLHLEISGTLTDIDDAVANLREWMTPSAITPSHPEGGAKAYLKYEPRGRVLLLAPWNFPFSLVFSPLVAIVAAGNTAIVKTNEMAPAVADVIAQIIAEAFDENEVAVFTGGVDVTVGLQELPFDHIFLTGSPRVGKMVMTAAAKHLASVTLELGGKCPAIVGPDADMAIAIPSIGIGRTFNLGQTCLCADYAIVPESSRDIFVQQLVTFLTDTYYVDGEYRAERNSHIVDVRNFNRVKSYIDDAVARGAKVAFGGGSDEDSLIIEPTILIDVPEDAHILEEEVFGPVLAIVTYETAEDIISIVRRNGKPLGMYLFARDMGFVDFILGRTSSGGVTVNGWANHWFENRLPFGGVNKSGTGRYHGVHGFRELSHERAVYIAA